MVFDVEWFFVCGASFISPGFSQTDGHLILARHRQESCHCFGHIQQLLSVQHNWGKAPLVRAPVHALGTGSTLAARALTVLRGLVPSDLLTFRVSLCSLYFLYANSIINLILLLCFYIALNVAH